MLTFDNSWRRYEFLPGRWLGDRLSFEASCFPQCGLCPNFVTESPENPTQLGVCPHKSWRKSDCFAVS